MKIGYVGLGRMGRGMALRLVEAGHELRVFDRSEAAVSHLVQAGATAAATAGKVALGADVIITSLPGPAEVEQVVFGPGGLLEMIVPGQVLFDTSTSSRTLAVRIDQEFRSRGASMLDAPVSGGPSGAATGNMAFWVGGDREVFDSHLPLLRVMGDKPRHCGPVGAGTVVKLANNMAGYMILLTLAEVFSMATKAGVEPLELWDALRLGVVGRGSPLDMLTAQFLPGRFEPPAFALKLAFKDVRLATDLARELGVPMRLANLTATEMLEGLSRGFEDQDSRSFMKLQLERAGVSIAVDPAALQERIDALKNQT